MLYDVKMGEGFNLQREIFPRVGHVVAEINNAVKKRCGGAFGTGRCAEWTIVLPPWCTLVHWWTDGKLVPWQEFFDLASLRSVKVPLLQFHEYVEITGAPYVDIVASLTDTRVPKEQRYGQKGGFYGWSNRLELCKDRVEHKFEKSQQQWRVSYAGDCDGGILAQDYRCAVFAQMQTRDFVDMALSLGQNVTSILLKKADSVSPPDNGELDKLGLRESMYFAEPLRLAGDEFIKSTLGGNPYLAVHCRRTDFLQARTATTPGLKATVAQINALLREQGLEQVFISTDAPGELRPSFKEQITGSVHFIDDYPDISRRFAHPGKKAIVEMWIAARADVFLGTQNSRFTMHIQLERGWLGKSEETSSRELCKSAGASSDRRISSARDSIVPKCTAPNYRHSSRKGARHLHIGNPAQGEE
jgi:peptide-O-fucosyltransferase